MPGHFDGWEVAGINDVAVPGGYRYLVRVPHIPAHLFPALMDDHLGTVPMVHDMLAHPLRERDVVRDQISTIAAERQTFGLTLGRSIQKADLDIPESTSARGCVEFARRDRISAEQEVLS